MYITVYRPSPRLIGFCCSVSVTRWMTSQQAKNSMLHLCSEEVTYGRSYICLRKWSMNIWTLLLQCILWMVLLWLLALSFKRQNLSQFDSQQNSRMCADQNWGSLTVWLLILLCSYTHCLADFIPYISNIWGEYTYVYIVHINYIYIYIHIYSQTHFKYILKSNAQFASWKVEMVSFNVKLHAANVFPCTPWCSAQCCI